MNRVALGLALLLLGLLASAPAQTVRVWSAAGNGSWNDPANWSGGVTPNSTNEIASIGVAATIALDNPDGFIVGGLASGAATVGINAGTGGGLTLDGSLAAVTNAGTLNLNVPVTSAGFIKAGAGNLFLTSDNRATLAGATMTVSEGQLRGYSGTMGNGYELGDSTTTLEVHSGAQIRFFNVTGGNRTYAPTLRLNGAGPAGGNPGALNNDSQTSANNLVWSGEILLDGDATIGAQNQGNYTLGRVTGPGRTLTLSLSANTTTFTGAMDVAALVKTGSGNVTFSGAGSLAAAQLDLRGGTVRFGSGTALSGVNQYILTGGSILDVETSATPGVLLESGDSYVCPGGLTTTLRGSLTLNAGAEFGPGAGTANFATLVVTNQLTVHGGTLRFDLNTTAGGANDRIEVTHLNLGAPADVAFSFPSGGPEWWAPYTVITYSGTLAGGATNLTASVDGGNTVATFSDATPGMITVTFSQSTNALVLNFTSGVQTYSALANATVTLGGRCELWLTTSGSPLPGSTVDLVSPDAWLVLPNIKPSTAVATVLPQIRVNGAAAVADANCRVVQHAMGAVVIPHVPSFQPLQVFHGPHFTGAAQGLSQYVYYRGAGLGAFNAGISSFRLKRGYLATFAQNESGSGRSRCYIAQDGDVEVSLLPSELENNIRFVYVLPWRWSSKKGIAGNIEDGLNLQWKYNWNISQNSTRDLEYVPIRQTRWWPGLSQDWQARGSSTLLGYNEPDRPDQANMSVSDAISSWPDLLATGLRVGSPATSDGGRDSWLYPFLQQADGAGLRVDFVAVHYYWCFNPADPNGAANQMYNFLKATYDQVKRPLWVTEWNNGANWTGCGDPTFAQQEAAIAAMIDMLDNTPFVERYALYNWVEDVRRVKWDDGSLTAAGATYRDQQSPISYVQSVPGSGLRSFAQLRLETNTVDTAGYGNNGVTAGSPAFTNGVLGQAMVFDGSNTVLTLPSDVATQSAFTFAAWIKWHGGGNWQRIFDFGNSTTHFLYLTPRSSGGKLRFSIKNGGGEQVVEAGALASNQWQHVAVTIGGNTARLYVNGALAASNTSLSISPASFRPRVNRLGKSQFAADPLFNGVLDEVLITDYALSPAQIAALQTNRPPQFADRNLTRTSAFVGLNYGNSLAGSATDADAGDSLSHSKISGPAWMSVSASGALTGTPGAGDLGTNTFTVRVTDAAGMNDFALLTLIVLDSPITLPAQEDRAVLELTALRITNTASGGLQPLSYALLDPPSGAAIDTSGVITWTASVVQGTEVFQFTTRATDSSLPPWSATNSFSVTVVDTNNPPVLTSPGNQTLNVGQWLVATPGAADPDLPPDPLTFWLLAGPAGAEINSSSGQVTWRPPVSRAGTLNWFTVRVADNGMPSLSATQSFAVLVNPLAPVSLSAPRFRPPQFSLRLSGESGPDYTLQVSTNLSPGGAWSNVLTTNLTVSPIELQHPVSADGSPQHFYRVLIGP